MVGTAGFEPTTVPSEQEERILVTFLKWATPAEMAKMIRDLAARYSTKGPDAASIKPATVEIVGRKMTRS